MFQAQTQPLIKNKYSVSYFLSLDIEKQQEIFLERGLSFFRSGSKLFETSYDLASNISFNLELLSSYNLLELIELIKDFCHFDFYYSKKDYHYHVTLYEGSSYGTFSHCCLSTALIVSFLLLKGVLKND